jgi:hypothetical protein
MFRIFSQSSETVVRMRKRKRKQSGRSESKQKTGLTRNYKLKRCKRKLDIDFIHIHYCMTVVSSFLNFDIFTRFRYEALNVINMTTTLS